MPAAHPKPLPDGIEHRLRLRDGRRLACLELGAATGQPVIYHHGFPGSRLEARLAADTAAQLGLRLLAADRPGFGESDFQPGRTLGGWADDVGELADRLDLRRSAVSGVSAGGPYALACAARLADRVEAVTLLAPLGLLDWPQARRGMTTLNRVGLGLAAWLPPLARGVMRLAAPWARRHPQYLLNRLQAAAPVADRAVLADPTNRAVLGATLCEALRQGGRGAAWELTVLARPWDFALEDVHLPVRIWHGLADTIVPPALVRHLAARLPCSEVRWLAGEGHHSLILGHFAAALAGLYPAGQ
jgi:pimeloyl-ACP methyl ester carboxylesterase